MTSSSNTLQPPWWNPRAQTRKQSSGQWILCIRGFQNHSRSASFQDPLFSAKKRSASHVPSLFFPSHRLPHPRRKTLFFQKKLASVLQAKILTRNTFIAKPHEAVRASSMNLESRIQYCFGQYLTWVCWKITEERGSTLDLSGGENSSARWDALTNILLSPVCAQLPGHPSPSKKIKGGGNSILKLSQTPTGHPREKL